MEARRLHRCVEKLAICRYNLQYSTARRLVDYNDPYKVRSTHRQQSVLVLELQDSPR